MNPDSTSTFDYHWVSLPMRVDAKAGDVAVNADTVATDTLATDSLKTDSLKTDSLSADSLPNQRLAFDWLRIVQGIARRFQRSAAGR